MAQSTDNTLSNQSGASFRTELNSILGAHLSSHKGGSEPSYITTGAFWIDDTSTPWIYKIYDGAASFGFLEINPSTNNVTLINVKDGDARTEGASIGQIQDGEFNVVGSVSGTNTITGDLSPAVTAYVEGLPIAFNPAGANTSATTIDLNSIGSAKALQINGQALVGGELATTDYVKAIYDGTAFQIISPTSKHPFKGLRFPDQGELTISSGAITVTGTHHTIDTESDAASDDLDTINGGSDGMIIIIRAENTARTVVIKNGTGNIETPDDNDITLDTTEKEVMLKYDGATSDWHVLSAPASAATTGWVPIKTVTASSSTTVDFVNGSGGVVLDGTYEAYAVVLTNVKPATDGTSLFLRTSTDAGASYDSGASDYATTEISISGIDTFASVNDQHNTEILIAGTLGNASTESYSGIVYFYGLSDTANYKQVVADGISLDTNGQVRRYLTGGARLSAADIDAIRFYMETGNTASGTFTLYGLASAS